MIPDSRTVLTVHFVTLCLSIEHLEDRLKDKCSHKHRFVDMSSVVLLAFYSTETNPRCSSPVDSGSSDADKQAKQNHEKSGERSAARSPSSLRLHTSNTSPSLDASHTHNKLISPSSVRVGRC